MSCQYDCPTAEYNEILPNLYQGGHHWESDGYQKTSRESTLNQDKSWGYVVSACIDAHRKNSFPRCDTRLVMFGDIEEDLGDDTWEQIRSAVDEVVRRWRDGQKVLIRCRAGYNRSGLMMALVLMRLGLPAEKAIWHVRWRRGRCALANQSFCQAIQEREAEYYDEEAFPETERLMNEFVPVVKS